MTLLYTHRLDVRFADCDPFGHVNNAVYLTYLEQARFHLWQRLWGLDRESALTAAGGAGLILARAECDYKAPATFGQTLDVRLGLAGIGRTSFTYDYEIVDAADRRVVATARTVLVLFDYAAGRPVEIDDERRAQLSRAFTE